MKKIEKIALADKVYKQIKDLGLETKIEGNWIVLSPPNKVPTQLIIDMAECSDFLMKLLENK